MGRAVTTIADRMQQARGRSSGFDYLRITLAALVVAAHLVSTTYGEAAVAGLWLAGAVARDKPSFAIRLVLTALRIGALELHAWRGLRRR